MTLARALGPALAGLVTLAGLRPLTAQDTTRVRADSGARADSVARRDTTRAVDSLHAHMLAPFLPAPPPEVPAGPLPPGSRYVFTRDSVLWSSALTLSDLLGSIPGVYIARGGFFGLPEYVSYAGRGAAALEIYWDGVEMLPMGEDSVYADPSHIPLTYVRRVDVEMLPGLLRVYLASERHETLEPRSVVRVMSGKFRTGAYAGLFQDRTASGIGLDLAADVRGTDGGSGAGRHDGATDAWAKVEWMPTPNTAAIYEIRRASVDRDLVTSDAGLGTIIAARHGRRDDYQFSFYSSSAGDGMGFRGNAGLAASTWSNDSTIPDQHLRRAFAGLGYQGASLSAEVRGLVADHWMRNEVSARAGWIPIPGIQLSGDAVRRTYDGDRTASIVHAAATLYRGPLALTGEWTRNALLEAPTLVADTAQRADDRAVRLGLTTGLLSGHVSLVDRGAFEPLPFSDFLALAALAPTPRATYLVADARLSPWKALTLDGWYANPIDSAVDYQPPTHGRAQLTFRSKFWRTFRSGAFDLKVQLAMESWSRGGAGFDQSGAPLVLPGISFYETYLGLQIVGFTAFFDARNVYRSRDSYVPGYVYARNAQVFGVRWEFTN